MNYKKIMVPIRLRLTKYFTVKLFLIKMCLCSHDTVAYVTITVSLNIPKSSPGGCPQLVSMPINVYYALLMFSLYHIVLGSSMNLDAKHT